MLPDELKDKEKVFWLKVIAGSVFSVAFLVMLHHVVNFFMSGQSDMAPANAFGIASPAVNTAVEDAFVKLIEALASTGAAVIIVFREEIVARIKKWWNRSK